MSEDVGPYCPRPHHRGHWRNGSPPLDRYTDGSGWSCPGVTPDGSACGYELRSYGASGDLCEPRDMIVPWPEVQPGDEVLWHGEFRRVEDLNPMDEGNPAIVLDPDECPGGIIPAGTYAAVRRLPQPAGHALT